jgi:predicted RNase H-like HicB family nuclease
MATETKTVPRFEIRPLSEIEGGGYLVEFPDYPGCVADGDTPERALEEGIDALNSYRRTLEELGLPVPAACLPRRMAPARAKIAARGPGAPRRARWGSRSILPCSPKDWDVGGRSKLCCRDRNAA